MPRTVRKRVARTTLTESERLVDLARAIRYPRDLLLIADRCVDAAALARVRLALDFEARPVLVTRAMIEGWNLDRIVRELR